MTEVVGAHTDPSPCREKSETAHKNGRAKAVAGFLCSHFSEDEAGSGAQPAPLIGNLAARRRRRAA